MKGIDQQTVMASLLTAAAGPVLNKYALILLAAFFGAMVTLSRMPQASWWGAVKQIFRSVCFATFLTGFGAYLIALILKTFFKLQVEAEEFIFPLAFLIAWVGDDLFRLRESGLKRAESHIRGKTDV